MTSGVNGGTGRGNRFMHGLSHTPEHNSWGHMIDRCLNPRNAAYKRYGGRGITVCWRWIGRRGFENFLSDMGPMPGVKYSLDRLDNDGNYEPTNCRWATHKMQQNNKGPSHYWAWEEHAEAVG
jgi:hypothetical protein